MKKLLITVTIVLLITLVNAQSIDSLEVFESNNYVDIKVEGTFFSIGPYISNLTYETIDNNINIDIFYVQCPGYAMLNPFDTTVNIGFLPSQNYLITCRSILDINLDSSNCSANYTYITSDSLTIYYNLLNINYRKLNEIEIFPNPFFDNIIIEADNLLNGCSILITDLSGKTIKEVSYYEPKQKINLEDLNQGVYLVNFVTIEDKQFSRRIVKIK